MGASWREPWLGSRQSWAGQIGCGQGLIADVEGGPASVEAVSTTDSSGGVCSGNIWTSLGLETFIPSHITLVALWLLQSLCTPSS